jgi:hypothetical protein
MARQIELRTTLAVVGIMLVWWGEPVGAADLTAQAGHADAPALATQHPQFLFRGMSPPGAHALRNRKQQLLREHHLSVKVKPAPAGVEAMAKPRAETAATVAATLAPLANPAITLVADRALTSAETNQETSTVCEPSVAARGNEVLYTGNWFASFSVNGGAAFQYRSPYNMFPSVNGGFCCDQVAIYDKQNDLMVWALQYVKDAHANTLRIVVAKGNDITTEQWRYYDFTPQNVGNWTDEWFDFPDLALSGSSLYVTSNVFSTSGDAFRRSVVLRLPLQQLAAYQALNYNYYSDQSFAPRVTQGARDTAYWAVQENLATLRIFTWPESGTSITQNDVTVQTWSDATRVAPGPDGRDWLGREDSRITAAWLSGDSIGFAWSGAQDSNFHYPHIRVAILDKNTKAVLAQPHIWNNDFAFAYPAAAPNSEGKVGISLHYGGGALFPSHAVGALVAATNTWQLVSTVSGRFGPADNKWGDFLTVRTFGADPTIWVATGYTLQTGPNATDIEARFIVFR